MTDTGKHRFGKPQLIPLLVYTLLLVGVYAVAAFGSRYELFMQTLDTLWPVIAFTLLLMLVVGNALLLARGIPLWLLCGLHATLTGVWAAALQIDLLNHNHAHEDGHLCAIIPPWFVLIWLGASTLPSLLGYLLLQLRKRRAQKPQGANASA